MNIVIVGGGFGGVKAALEMSKRKLGNITLISDTTYFLHHATLYSTATGKSTSESVIPLEEIFAYHPKVKVVIDKMSSIEPRRKLVICGKKSYEYDQLVIAIGSVTSYFNINGVAEHSFGIKSLEEVKAFNGHLKDEILTKKHLDKEYVIIGAGPTGIELAGVLRNYIQHLLDISHMPKHQKIRLTIVEAAPRILPRSSKTASTLVMKRLKSIGVRVLINHKVEALDTEFITIDGKQVPTETAVWTSGVANNPFFAAHSEFFKIAKNGRIEVNEHLMAHENIYVIGDNNTVKYSGTALPAFDQATFVAKHLFRLKNHKNLRKFRPKEPPTGLPVGKKWGYVEWHGIYVAGKAGYLAKRLIELYGYCQLVPLQKALILWKAHNIPEIRL